MTDSGVRPRIAVAAGSGLVARAAVAAGADSLLVLNAGRYRSLGIGSLASFLPFGNANQQTWDLLQEILPVAAAVPVIAGVFAADPDRRVEQRLSALKSLGVWGVTNWPSLGFVDGQFREALEDDGVTAEQELAMLAAARSCGLATVSFVHSPEDAVRFAAVSDEMILNIGLTQPVDRRQDHRDQIQSAISRLHAMRKAARGVNPQVSCLMFGGIVTSPQDLETVLVRCDIDGFAGGSVFERIPVQAAVESTIRQFCRVAETSRLPRSEPVGPLVGNSLSMRRLRDQIGRVARFDVNVCIEGETGTGKELVAAEIHRQSPRREAPFITLNCGAITDSLLESELFGYEKGAFTGAERRHVGKFELADRGTLFLDEVADLSPRAQVALLRAIQQGEVLRIGSESPIHVNVRIVTATHFNLQQRVDAGLFRADLYFRLNQMPLRVPALAERLEDLRELIPTLLTRLEARIGRRIGGVSAAFEEQLRAYPWPGNIRELESVLCRSAILEDHFILEGAGFAAGFQPETGPGASVRSMVGRGKETQGQRARIAVEQAGGNKSEAAAHLGVSRKTLYAWLRETETGDSASTPGS